MIDETDIIEEDAIEEIAVIGLSGRFPGAPDVDVFWQNLRNGVDSISRYTDQELEALGVSPELFNRPDYVKVGTILENVDRFDATFFNINPGEAELTDPQHRIFLECAWEALESAGYNVENCTEQTGVFAGTGPNDYEAMLPVRVDKANLAGTFQRQISNINDFLSTRVSYKLNLKGPSLTVQTACSTSLVAVQLACQSLLTYQCNMALAGGVSIDLQTNNGYVYQDGMILSPDGYCRAFDAKAKGTVLGQGAGIVVLKRLSEAIADGDQIYAVIKAIAINNDGSDKISYTAPSVDGQASAIATAQALAGVTADTITYVETHGTGTPMGDPVEIEALTQAFRASTDQKGFCAIGSVKTNVGHLDTAAGITGLIKTVLALKHQEIPPSLHYDTANPEIDFANSPFYVNTKLSRWQSSDTPRRAGVSSFGIGGTNAHLILEEAPPVACSEDSSGPQLLVWSARSASALDHATSNLADHLQTHPEVSLSDVAYTLQTGRKMFDHRRFVVAEDIEGAVSALVSGDLRRIKGMVHEAVDRSVVFLFPGQGSQYVHMGRELYQSEHVFREHVDACAHMLESHLHLDIRDILYPEEGATEEATDQLRHTLITQPALFVIEYALARLWMGWGILPSALMGHSIGEYVAACLSGVFSLEDALALVAARGRLISELPDGSMLAVPLSEQALVPYLNGHLAVAAINSPELCVVSGTDAAVAALADQLSQQGTTCQHLHTSHAFHSQMVDPILEAFKEKVQQVTLQKPQIPIMSTVTGQWVAEGELTDPGYWVRNLRQTVRFSDGAGHLLAEGDRIFLEVGPGQTLSTLIRRHRDTASDQVIVSSMRHPQQQISDVACLLEALGQLWLSGVDIDWQAFYAHQIRHRVPLPTYPFERKRFWLEAQPQEAEQSPQDTTDNGHHVDHQETVQPAPHALYKRPDLPNDYVPPSNQIEHTLAQIWQQHIGIEHIGIHDDYFALGGDSLLALQMFVRIEQTSGYRLPLATLFQAPTIAQLAQILQEQGWAIKEPQHDQWSALVPIQPDGTKPPIFLVHGHEGNVLCFRDLAHHMGDDQPFYAFQDLRLNQQHIESMTIEEIAGHYISQMQAVQPQGPYCIGGWCFGGIVAYEMAQQLVAEGQTVGLLAILHTDHPDYPRYLPNTTTLHRGYYSLRERFEFEVGNLRQVKAQGRLSYMMRRCGYLLGRAMDKVTPHMQAILVRTGLLSPSQAYILHQIGQVNDEAFRRYETLPYTGHVVLIRASDEPRGICPDQTLGWGDYIKDDLEVRKVSGHRIGMLDEPRVCEVAEQVALCLEQARAGVTHLKPIQNSRVKSRTL